MEFKPVIAIPARNEAERLPFLLQALNRQIGLPRSPLDIVLVLNNSTDRSAEVVAELIPSLGNLALEVIDITFPEPQAHVGSARKLAMDWAAEIIGTSSGVILTTDADGTPHPDWVAQNLRAIEAGADLVGGRIFGNADEEAALGEGFRHRAAQIAAYSSACDHLTALIDPLPHDPWPRHQDHTGASLAIPIEVYRAVGGLPALPFREDLGLVERVLSQGHKLVHPESVVVTVSARLKGRAPGGMADCIAGWLEAEAQHAPILVEDPRQVERRAFLRAELRSLPGRPRADWAATLQAFGADPARADTLDLDRRAVAQLIQALVPNAPDAPCTVPVSIAMAQILARIFALEGMLHAA